MNTFESTLEGIARRWQAWVFSRRPQHLLGFGLLFAAAQVWRLLFPPPYQVVVAFTPSGQTSSPLRGIATQLGLDVGVDPSVSPDFYAELLRSFAILSDVAKQPYYLDRDSTRDTVTLAAALSIRPGPSQGEATVRRLRSMIQVTGSRRTNLVTATVASSNAAIATQVASELMDAVGRFNRTTRASRAKAERTFIESRLDKLSAELKQSEDEFALFLARNRDYRVAPFLQVQHDRLQREVLRRQSVVTSLEAAVEQARIEEVRDTPVITVVEPPREPTLREGSLVQYEMIATLVALVIGTGLSLGLFVAKQVRGRTP